MSRTILVPTNRGYDKLACPITTTTLDFGQRSLEIVAPNGWVFDDGETSLVCTYGETPRERIDGRFLIPEPTS